MLTACARQPGAALQQLRPSRLPISWIAAVQRMLVLELVCGCAWCPAISSRSGRHCDEQGLRDTVLPAEYSVKCGCCAMCFCRFLFVDLYSCSLHYGIEGE
jgi:hypothetical protein